VIAARLRISDSLVVLLGLPPRRFSVSLAAEIAVKASTLAVALASDVTRATMEPMSAALERGVY